MYWKLIFKRHRSIPFGSKSDNPVSLGDWFVSERVNEQWLDLINVVYDTLIHFNTFTKSARFIFIVCGDWYSQRKFDTFL